MATMRDIQAQGQKDGYAYRAALDESANLSFEAAAVNDKAAMRESAATVCGLNLIAQGHYETGFETGIVSYEDGN